LCDVIFAIHYVLPQFVYKRLDQLTDKMSDSDESFDILRDTKPYNFEPLEKKVIDSINCEELAVGSAYVDTEQPPVPPTLIHNKSWIGVYLFCVGISLIDKSTN